jgi:hypothetical protein
VGVATMKEFNSYGLLVKWKNLKLLIVILFI